MGFGDAVTPEAATATFPTLLQDFQAPVLRVYPVYTVIAEKYHAMVMLGQANSRMKDFYDLAVINRRTALDSSTLARTIAATFARRNTALPLRVPFPQGALWHWGFYASFVLLALIWYAFAAIKLVANVWLVPAVVLAMVLLAPAPSSLRWQIV